MKKIRTYGKKPYEIVDPYRDLYISVAVFGIVFALTIMVVMSFVAWGLQHFGII